MLLQIMFLGEFGVVDTSKGNKLNAGLALTQRADLF